MVSTGRKGFPRPFGKYELLERVGDGGMAEVFRARLPGVAGFEKIVVVKKILPHLAKKRRFVDMFVAEAKLAAEVTHKNVVQVFELGQLPETGEFYMAMEYVHGTDLRHVLGYTTKRGLRLPPWFSVYVVCEILEGLHYAHMLKDQQGAPRNIVHRDVTPSNIFISNKGEVKLGDFGVAKDSASASRTRTGQLKGKIGYMSPEQVRSLPVDPRTDVFALGIVLWETLAQRRLFKGRSDFEAMTLICNAERVPPSAHVDDVPKALDETVLRALEPDIEKRISSAREMQASLLNVLPQLKPTVRSSDVEALLQSLTKTPGEQGAMMRYIQRPTASQRGGSFSGGGTPSPSEDLEFEESDSEIQAPPVPGAPGVVPPQRSPSTPSAPVAPPTSSSSAVPPARTGSTPGDVPVIVGNPTEPRRRGPSTRVINAAVRDAAQLPVESPSGAPAYSAFAGEIPQNPSREGAGASTIRPGLEVREHGEDVSSAERLRWQSYGLVGRAYDGVCPFWVQNHEGYVFGPVSYEEALTVVKAESLASYAAHARISADQRRWIDLEAFARLTGQPMLLRSGEERIPLKTSFHGNLTTRSMTNILGSLAQRNATGRLYVTDTAHQARASREIDFVRGRPTYVYAHSEALQLPRLLVTKKLVPESMMLELIHRAVAEQRPLEDIAGEKVGTDLRPYHPVFMKDRLVDMFDWPAGRFAFDDTEEPTHVTPFARSLFALLLEMVARRLSASGLKHHLRDLMNVKLRPAESLDQRVPELGLNSMQLEIVQKLAKGKKLSVLAKREDEKTLLALAYVLVETELLRPPR